MNCRIKKTFFKINKYGSRGSNKFKKIKLVFMAIHLLFVDMLMMKRPGNSICEKKYKSNVLNFGVGNYGIDQAFLKYLKKKKKLDLQKLYFVWCPRPL